jgi:hypothetical protein
MARRLLGRRSERSFWAIVHADPSSRAVAARRICRSILTRPPGNQRDSPQRPGRPSKYSATGSLTPEFSERIRPLRLKVSILVGEATLAQEKRPHMSAVLETTQSAAKEVCCVCRGASRVLCKRQCGPRRGSAVATRRGCGAKRHRCVQLRGAHSLAASSAEAPLEFPRCRRSGLVKKPQSSASSWR